MMVIRQGTYYLTAFNNKKNKTKFMRIDLHILRIHQCHGQFTMEATPLIILFILLHPDQYVFYSSIISEF